MILDYKMFWNMLTEENKDKAEEILKNYTGSEGIKGKIFDLYEESASCSNMKVGEYLKNVSPNEYVEWLYSWLYSCES